MYFFICTPHRFFSLKNFQHFSIEGAPHSCGTCFIIFSLIRSFTVGYGISPYQLFARRLYCLSISSYCCQILNRVFLQKFFYFLHDKVPPKTCCNFFCYNRYSSKKTVSHTRNLICYSFSVYTAISFFTSASVIFDLDSHENETVLHPGYIPLPYTHQEM